MLMHALDKGWSLITACLNYAHNQWYVTLNYLTKASSSKTKQINNLVTH